ncbi:ABC transporter permease [Gemmobacter lutimaris]|jgi:His/Glu/Gln/Arg/opine family amino acid ABC transporter permease subunit|uniref:Histidine ABC transporter permease n=3 Tax=Gemmobacter TaxID=204456 RepID=A0A918J0F3_9RHOB|nr:MULTISPECIES: ABC transporter permease [Paracoccaceae]PTX47314.1 amino acid ABC transporter membrane protein 1 (PAAT family) [Gemmobacter caeni]RID90267.1 ABC transporter permease [Gemmobacter lutimaris]TWI96426.1 amino acid ABC transporter membrane protein 1 (PAAT family) [Gemmobacter caeni]GGW39326.1 histidine ABC transporter permease [Gemmobacter lanyuensis]HPD93749.1 ABC transporter permease [Pararhodobacter sp.]
MDLLIEYRSQLWAGLVTTVQIALASLFFSVALGLIGAWAKLSANRTARALAGAYTTLVRGVPDLVLIMLVFFGGQVTLNAIGAATGLWDYLEVSQFAAGALTIGVIFGAYFTETFRGAILAIPRGQIEAGISIGMSRPLLFRRIVWPQMVRYALPGFGNNWLVQLKTTALVSVIGLQDLVYNAFAAGRSTDALFTFMAAAFVIYLGLTALSDLGLRALERRYSRGVQRA